MAASSASNASSNECELEEEVCDRFAAGCVDVVIVCMVDDDDARDGVVAQIAERGRFCPLICAARWRPLA
jgi:hypothetical protein